ncbi:YtxH domain-containing protein [Calidifontibacillus oryziterrae]|uniref:YtxH domain-containing protein n=1 Tax=Calidifontibacillus oryziterrae TaxID=1191699 RepID=UPI0002E45271|nr:YtxH domain-containing protein [Calidifontibacillus oryziterrae]
MARGKSLFLGLFVGTIAGAATVMLTTPKNGNEIRQIVKQNSTKVIEAIDNLKSESIKLKNQINNASMESITILKDFSKDVKTSVQAWKDDIEPNQTRIVDELKNIEESIKELEILTKKREAGPN